MIPTIDDNGFVLWESSAIVRYLGRTYGGGTLSPTDEHSHARADSWMDWSLTTLYGDIIYTCFLQLVRTPAKDRDLAAVDAARKRVDDRLGVLDRQLAGGGPLILGSQLTIADIAVGTLMYRYYNLSMPRRAWANVEAWYKRLTERPAYQTHVMIDFRPMTVADA